MPLFNQDAVVNPAPPTPPTVTAKPVVDTASMYSNLQYKNNLIAYLDGSPWTCTYYAQFLGLDDVVINSNDVVDPTLKQYLKIHEFELRVTSPLANSLNAAIGASEVSGQSNVYPVITPIAGDVFIAMIQAGVYGVFEVTAIERASQFLESAWIITYHQIDYVEHDTVNKYDAFVVGELVFDVTQLDTGSNPLHTVSEQNRTVTSIQLQAELIAEYCTEFYDSNTKTFIMPYTSPLNGTQYDHFMVKFWNEFISKDLYPGEAVPVLYDIDSVLCSAPYSTVFDALVEQSPAVLKYCVTAMRTLSVDSLDARYQRHSIRVSGVSSVVFPYTFAHKTDPTLGNTQVADFVKNHGMAPVRSLMNALVVIPTVDATALLATITTMGIEAYIAANGTGSYTTLLGLISTYGIDITNAVFAMSQIPTYIFSNRFYYGLVGQNPLETQVTKAINKEAILFADIKALVDARDSLSLMDKFYQIPFFLVLLQMAR